MNLVYFFTVAIFLSAIPILLLLGFVRNRRKLAALKPEPPRVIGNPSKRDVINFVQSVLGPEARFDETPCKDKTNHVYGIVSHPNHHRVINQYDGYSPAEGRRRVIQRFLDPAFVAETRKS